MTRRPGSAAPSGSAGSAPALARLLALLAAEAPLEDLTAVLADPGLAPSDARGAAEVRDAVRDALAVRSLLANRRRREQELSALYETAGDLSSLRELEAVLQAIVHRARQLLDTDAAYLMLHDEDRRLTYMRVTDGIRTDAFKQTSLRLGAGLGGLVAATSTPYATADYGADQRLRDRIDDVVAGEGLVAILGVPLRRRGHVIGVLFAANRRQRPFGPDEAALLTSLADHAAIALENASLFADVQTALDDLRQANELVRRHSEQVERATAVHERLNEVMLTGGGLPEIVAAVGEVLGGDLTVLDAHGRTVVTGGDPEATRSLLEVLTQEHGVLPGTGEASSGDRTPLRSTLQHDGPAGTPVAVVPVYAGAEALGTVVFAGRVLDDLAVRTLERAAVVTALLLLRERSIAEAEQRVRGELIDDLVALPQRDPEALRRRAAHLGLDLQTPYVVVVARPVDGELAVALRAGTLPGEPRPGLHGQHAGDLVLLVRGDEASTAAARLSAQLSAASGGAFTVGAAGPATGTAAVPELFRDAVRCCEVLVSLGRAGEHASADDLGVYSLLLGEAGRADVSRFVRRTVGPLLDYDRERGSELARTLLTYYVCGGNLTRTAAALYVHVNTLYQRLDRVSSLLGDAWRSGDGALQAHLALKAHAALGHRPDA